ncbi:hypothetical protein, partial [Phocaeicola vulgatus]
MQKYILRFYSYPFLPKILNGKEGVSKCTPSVFLRTKKVCQNAYLLFLCTKPRLSQAGALL